MPLNLALGQIRDKTARFALERIASHRIELLQQVYSGNGSPEGVVTAGIGSIYLRRNGGAGTTLYVKESGAATTNTGWVGK